jgi:hypothetical protein
MSYAIAQLVACYSLVQATHVQFPLVFFLSTMSVMALEAIIFIFSFWFLHYFSLLSSLIHNQEREERS